MNFFTDFMEQMSLLSLNHLLMQCGEWELSKVLGSHSYQKEKYKNMDLSFQNVIKWSILLDSLRKKIWSWKNNGMLNLWKKDAIWIILQEVVGLQNDQKILVDLIWLTTAMSSSG